MEVDERPTEQYSDIGGLDKQIEEVCATSLHAGVTFLLFVQLIEAIVLPITHKERFENIGIQPPKGKLHILGDVLFTMKCAYFSLLH